MEPLDWQVVRSRIDELAPKTEKLIERTSGWIKKYRSSNHHQEALSTILHELNILVFELGELQARYERLKNWTDKRYEIEKAIEAVKIIRTGKAGNYAKEAKYEEIEKQDYLQAVVDSSAMHMRIQNARSSARDTTEGIRSRISTLKGSMRSQ